MKKVIMLATEEIVRDQRVMKEADYISSRGYDVEILCWDRENQFSCRPEERVNNVKIKRMFHRSVYGSGFKQILPFMKFIWDARRYLKKQNIDFLHCQNLDGFIVALFVKKKTNLVFDMREFYEGREKNRLKRQIIRYLVDYAVKKANYIIHVNDFQKNSIATRHWSKLVFLPNFPESFLGASVDKQISERINIAYIGSIRQIKEFQNLFEATRGLEDVCITINGSGPLYSELRSMETRYDNVRITGTYNPSETSILYRQTDLLYCVYSIENENWRHAYPIKFFEAIITLTPVIVNKGTVLESFVHEYGIGFAVDGRNIDEIRALIRTITTKKALLEEKRQNLEKIQFNFCWEGVVNNLDKVYQ